MSLDSLIPEKIVEEQHQDTTDLEQCHLIIWNDNVNTFDWVIKALVEICHHSQEQAEQCTWLIHFKGKYAVKNGTFDDLKPMCENLIDWGINATID